MGFLDRATQARASADAPAVDRGEADGDASSGAFRQVTQDELDRLSAIKAKKEARRRDHLLRRHGGRPERVPRRWRDSGRRPPSERPALLRSDELAQALAGSSFVDGDAESGAAVTDSTAASEPAAAPAAAAMPGSVAALLADLEADTSPAAGSYLAPVYVFHAVQRRLGLQFAALLTPGIRPSTLVVEALTGWSGTTAEQLQLDLTVAPGPRDSLAFASLVGDRPLRIEEPSQLAAYTASFAAADRANLHSVLLVPFVMRDQLLAVLVVGDRDNAVAQHLEVEPAMLIAQCCRRLAPTLLLRHQLESAVRTGRAALRPTRRLLRGRPREVQALNLAPAAAAIREAAPHTVQLRLQQHLRDLVAALLARAGTVAAGDATHVLLAVAGDADAALLVHRASHTLAKLVGPGGQAEWVAADGLIEVQTAPVADDASDVAAILAQLGFAA